MYTAENFRKLSEDLDIKDRNQRTKSTIKTNNKQQMINIRNTSTLIAAIACAANAVAIGTNIQSSTSA